MTAPFSPALFEFLIDLDLNNRKDWFDANKARYESDVREPAFAFIREVGERFLDVSPHFVASDKKSGGSLMRVYRDTRFSKDKTPYKTNVGVHFRHEAGKDVHAPGFYVHLHPDDCFIGVGMWRPDSPSLRAIRDRIVAEPNRYRAIVDAPEFTDAFSLSGASLKNAPRGFDKDHPLVDELKRKDFIAVRHITPEDVLRDDLIDFLMENLRTGAPLMGFLAEAVGHPF
ncbi:MAG: hypothetical protein ACI81R_000518 [Bradymonadia bacterium]|jgi:uncharacterized protein (TIGR02453 family)